MVFIFFKGEWPLKVLKTINNSVVSCIDSDGTELVVMGKGLAFRVRPGDRLEPGDVEKIFRMDSPEQTHRLKDLFAQLSPRLLELCTQIIDRAKATIGHQLNQSVYLTLTDHIDFALSRVREGRYPPNPLLTEVRVFYPVEYSVGEYALELIQRELGVTFQPDEAASIALHLVNAEYDGTMSATIRAAQILPELVRIMEQWPGLRLDRDHLYYNELIVHLKFLAMQTFTDRGQEWMGARLAQNVRQYLPTEFECAGAMAAFLTEKGGSTVPSDEQAYLALCIHRACI